MILPRRRFLGFIAAAPAIVRAASLMPVRAGLDRGLADLGFSIAPGSVNLVTYGRSPAMDALAMIRSVMDQVVIVTGIDGPHFRGIPIRLTEPTDPRG